MANPGPSGPNYDMPPNPEYNPNIPSLSDTDPAIASQIFNPWIKPVIENIHAVKLAADKLAEDIGSGGGSRIWNIPTETADFISQANIGDYLFNPTDQATFIGSPFNRTISEKSLNRVTGPNIIQFIMDIGRDPKALPRPIWEGFDTEVNGLSLAPASYVFRHASILVSGMVVNFVDTEYGGERLELVSTFSIPVFLMWSVNDFYYPPWPDPEPLSTWQASQIVGDDLISLSVTIKPTNYYSTIEKIEIGNTLQDQDAVAVITQVLLLKEGDFYGGM